MLNALRYKRSSFAYKKSATKTIAVYQIQNFPTEDHVSHAISYNESQPSDNRFDYYHEEGQSKVQTII